MKMAKANQADLDMAADLCGAFESLTQRWGAYMPEAIQVLEDDDDPGERFENENAEQCRRALNHLLDMVNRGSLFRVVMGCAVMLDPSNQCVDPAADTIEHHPITKAGQAARLPRPLADWQEDMGAVLWWRFPIEEAPYCGHPNCDNWPGYHTHWTPLVLPDAPAEQQQAPA